jgi:MYXO-CTERM domain-containing protein
MNKTLPLLLATTALSVVACAPESDLPMGALLVDEPGSAQQAIHAVCPRGATTFGIDVSKWQGSINWSAVAGDGVKFAIIRVSDGLGYHDEYFAQNWAGAKANGIIRGAYQFFRSDDDPIAQADLLVDTMGPLEPGDLPPVADVESTDGVGNAARADRLRQWLDRVEQRTGVRPIIYTGGYFWQDNVGQDFSQYPLWHAGYTGGDCPSTVANQWPDWTFWQYSSSGSVAGISGNVDVNRFNGSLDELREFARSNQKPRGYVDNVDCEAGVRGWAQDPDAPDTAIAVHVYLDGEAGSGAHGFATVADQHRDDLCSAIGSCAHGYAWRIPAAFRDDAAHTAFVYAIDTAGGPNPQLVGSGIGFTCAPPARPLDVDKGVLRHVTSPEAMTAWSFSFDGVARYAPDEVHAYGEGPAWRDAPRLVQADGEPEVYLVDVDSDGAEILRHVTSPDSMRAWGFSFDAIEHLSVDEVHARATGPALPVAPFLLRAEGEPAVYVLDVAPPVDAGEGEGEPAQGGEGEGEAGSGDDGGEVERVTLLPPDGCAATSTSDAAALLLVLTLLPARRRRR